ncbi:4-hydroxyphenylpyruvate dioxygenase, putative [Talaromyces stipitatus ATCC 10500]|uniref:4-hydroxyphenylpyruvate dioxygenase, putative n=1 Tax=Talaromyces stipitatus (strain ATCC 10500 / CBS 375.48 / QM 6759 / NRRL 1006) TaxID=441959 RepID=B8MQY0_TALSN|nr:4-hydroxyphenylpyruvate dioxygenase, putative [Talaromyces stipitatus ATCC 10500]EED12815.1 4-hydroxyphenylpyruvate dioxygenase, putative [Talaromyces stipitatus ATCC 10500]
MAFAERVSLINMRSYSAGFAEEEQKMLRRTEKCAPAISTMSLGRAWVHCMPEKLHQAAKAGFQGIELFYEDLEGFAKSPGEGSIIDAAREIRRLCDLNQLAIINLQPFGFYGGLLDREKHKRKIEEIKFWFRLVKILRTDLIHIPSNFLPKEELSDAIDLLVSDMTELADLGLEERPPVRFAFESLCWGTYVDTWEQSYEVVQRVNRVNFGCCLDTFNIAGRIWADPESPSGRTQNADTALKASLDRMRATIDIEKVFFIQLVDAERMKRPLIEGHPWHVKNQPPRMSWSRNARLFAYETDRGGYLPILDIAKTILRDLGYKGWVSMELFSRTMADPDPSVPATHAKRGIDSWKKLSADILDIDRVSHQCSGRL